MPLNSRQGGEGEWLAPPASQDRAASPSGLSPVPGLRGVASHGAWTPGPWEAFRRPRGLGITGATEADFVIPANLSAAERECVVDYAVARCLTSLKGYDPAAERQANAHLIASAPELYEALSAMVAEQVDYMTINNLGDPEQQHNVKLARAALAKARGQ